MEKERELPEITINGRPWLIDVKGYQIIQKEEPKNWISALSMDYFFKQGYRFNFSKSKQSLAEVNDQDPDDILQVRLSNFTKMDPEGVAMKYGLSASDVKDRTDYEVMIDKKPLIDRLEGELNTVDIYGDTYYVDSEEKLFIPKARYLRNDITFESVLNYYNKESDRCEFPYDYRKQQIAEIDKKNITDHPACVVIVALPKPELIDPIGYAITHGINPAEILKRLPHQAHIRGEIREDQDSWLNRLIEANRHRTGLKKGIKNREQQTKRKRVKMR